MAQKKKDSKTLEQTIQVVKYGSPEHDVLLEAGYGMTVAEAELIIKERKENPLSHPYERAQAAMAMLEARKAKPIPIDTDPGWKRQRRR